MENAAAQEGSGWLSATLLGFTIEELLLAGFAMLIAIAGRFLFAAWANRGVEWLTAKTDTTLDDKFGEAITPPLTLLPIAVGFFFATQALNLTGLSAGVAESAAQTLFAVTVFWALLRSVDPAAEALKSLKSALTPTMMQWFKRSTRVLVWLIGGATILELWGIRVLPIIAGLGLLGVAVALGAQDLFKNLISGLLILSERRFCKGDWVKVDGVVEGTVEEIGFRSTKIRRFDRAPVYVPNAAFADDAVVNFGEMTHRRISWTIGLEYRTTAAQLKAIREKIEAYIEGDERFTPAPDAPQFVRLEAFADSSINLMIYIFTQTTKWGEWLAIKEELLLKVKEIVEGEGAGFAFPSTSIYVERAGAFEGRDLLDSDGPAPKGGAAKPPAAAAKRATRSTAKTPAKSPTKSASKSGAKPSETSTEKPGPADNAKDAAPGAPENSDGDAASAKSAAEKADGQAPSGRAAKKAGGASKVAAAEAVEA